MFARREDHSRVVELSLLLLFSRRWHPGPSHVPSIGSVVAPITPALKLGQLISDLEVACVQLALQVHRQTLASVESRLESAANFANFHVFVLAH